METEQLRGNRMLAEAEKSLEELSNVVLDADHFDEIINNIHKALKANYITLEEVQKTSEKRNDARAKLKKEFYYAAGIYCGQSHNPDFNEILKSKILDRIPHLLVIEERGRMPIIDFPEHIKGNFGQRKLKEAELDNIYTIGRDLFREEIAREGYIESTLQSSFTIFRTIFVTAYKESHPSLYKCQI